MSETLNSQDLRLLVQRVFQLSENDRGLAIIVDLPDEKLADNPHWAQRRAMAAGWYQSLLSETQALGLHKLTLAWYPNVGGNNGDLPEMCYPGDGTLVPGHASDISNTPVISFAQLFADHSIVLAPTELSATAPLKVATRNAGTGPDGFRAATMPGFLPSMIPALRLDYGEINRRVDLLKDLLDQSESAAFIFEVEGKEHLLNLDLRHNGGHASGGLFPNNGIAGNLPSGEAYIVPYEGHIPGDASLSAGTMPVQIDDEVVLYKIEKNKAVKILTEGQASTEEARHIAAEPAYANLAELGLGVLGDFNLQPTGSILLDEKLGLHIAFGRSDHFGGTVSPADFSCPEAVIHLDRVYIPEMQPKVKVSTVYLKGPGLDRLILENGVFVGLEAE
jgi:aminopeptidase